MIVHRYIPRLLAGALLATSALAQADPGRSPTARNEIAVYQGAMQFVLLSALVDCSASTPTRLPLRTTLTYGAVPGVCDDLGDVPCGGRIVAQMERCVDANLPLAAGGLAGGYSRSPIRFCYLEDASTPCDEASVVAEGSWVGAGRGAATDTTPLEATPLEATAQLKIATARPFRIDGREVRIRRGDQQQFFTLERPTQPPGCLGVYSSGCGVIGVGLP